MNFMKKAIGDSADKHDKHASDIDGLKDSRSEHKASHASLADRVSYIEKLLGKSADMQGRKDVGN